MMGSKWRKLLTPSFLLLVLIVLVFYDIYIIRNKVHLQCFNPTAVVGRAKYVQTNKGTLPYNVNVRYFPEYLKTNERVRERFLEKREKDIFAGRGLKEIGLWERRDGWQFVWNSFPPLFSCPHLVERVGTAKDGGKWVCGLDIFEKESKRPCVIYSFGVGLDSTFEVEMVSKTHCSVYAYDHTVDGMELPNDLDPQIRNRIHFFKLGLGSPGTKEKAQKDERFRTLGQIMEENGHEWIDFLKVDIEGAEFEVLTEVNKNFDRVPYGHLNMEIHLDKDATLHDLVKQREEFQKLFHFWESLEIKGLRAWWWEGNHYMGATGKGPPVLMEYAFINVEDVERNRLIQF